MIKRSIRQEAIKDIIREMPVKTQQELVEELDRRGIVCTQATVSRDVSSLDLQKLPNGSYALREDQLLRRVSEDLMTDVAYVGNQVIVKTRSGMAQGVAAVLEEAVLPGLLGTIAGDDTILMVAADESSAQLIVARLRGFREAGA
ncbi:MAG: ArgR family transcriptional regulator [Coriobacteriales bacterium]|jgi:transcriptional regulator of arginine metabolism|nr:ArgR family transcriptional regulator [Coriobacteriales bacterium]